MMRHILHLSESPSGKRSMDVAKKQDSSGVTSHDISFPTCAHCRWLPVAIDSLLLQAPVRCKDRLQLPLWTKRSPSSALSSSSTSTRSRPTRQPHARLCPWPGRDLTGCGAQVFGGIREIFQVFDTNGDKALDAAELRHAFACMVMRELYRSCAVMTSVACACDSMLT